MSNKITHPATLTVGDAEVAVEVTIEYHPIGAIIGIETVTINGDAVELDRDGYESIADWVASQVVGEH